MITRIEKDLFFVAGVHFDGAYAINSYDMVLSMLIETDNPREQHIANERIDHFVKTVLSNSTFVNEENEEEIENYLNAGIEVCTLPTDPYDQIVAMAVLLKLNAIMEGRMKITDITIGSLLGEGIRYPIVSEIAESAELMVGDHWWHKSNTCTRNDTLCGFELENNVVKLFDDSDWFPIGLSWKEKSKNT